MLNVDNNSRQKNLGKNVIKNNIKNCLFNKNEINLFNLFKNVSQMKNREYGGS